MDTHWNFYSQLNNRIKVLLSFKNNFENINEHKDNVSSDSIKIFKKYFIIPYFNKISEKFKSITKKFDFNITNRWIVWIPSRWRTTAIRWRRAHKRSQILCRLSMKATRETVNIVPPTFWYKQCTRKERRPFRVKRLKFSSDKLEYSCSP